MIEPFTDDTWMRILGIDPGSNDLGIAIIEVHPETFEPKAVYASTIHLKKLLHLYEQCEQIHGEKIAKLFALEKAMKKLLQAWMPDVVVSESPYMGKFPAAYAALVECLSAIRRALHEHDPNMPLHTLDPATIKAYLGVSGKSGDKDKIYEALCGHKELVQAIDLDELDEHAHDALAVAHAKYKRLFED